MKEASASDLRRIQLNILFDIDQFCKENGIHYFLMYGTLLGAVRHNGFIPWDDDIDLCMLRQDYNRFVELYNKKSHYVVREQSLEPSFPFYYAKICDVDTHLYEIIDGKKFDTKIGIDLFPLDDVPDHLISRFIFLHKITFLRSKLISGTVNPNCKRKLYKQVLLTILKTIFKKPANTYYKELRAYVNKFYNNTTTNVMEIMTPYGKNAVFNRKIFLKTSYLKFENMRLPVPHNYKKLLEQIYGDYMILPPPEKRVSHHAFKAYIDIEGK